MLSIKLRHQGIQKPTYVVTAANEIVVGNVIGNTLSNPRATSDIFGSAFRGVWPSFDDMHHGTDIVRRVSGKVVQAVAEHLYRWKLYQELWTIYLTQ